MKILVVGSGGREHALVWKLAQSPKVSKIYAAPGNGGIEDLAEVVNIKVSDLKGLADFAGNNGIDLTIVGPEAPLVEGIVDVFTEKNLRIFGPTREASQLEGSKVFAKKICRKYNIPTSNFEIFDDPKKAKSYIDGCDRPQVVKADGLAQGKGVIVAKDRFEAKKAIDTIMVNKKFGDAGNKVIVEERLFGEEASIIVLSDGKNILPLASSQDHKQIYDGDRGPNTGGMGAYSPASVITEEVYNEVINKIMQPAINALREKGRPYKGVLYAGIMVTDEGPKLLEFNVRFGDPETQAILPRLESDLVEAIEASIDGGLDEIRLKWNKRSCVCVVMASGGYPGNYEKGKEIFGLDKVKNLEDIIVFHAGTKKENGRYFTNGGRVLGVTGLGASIEDAKDYAYKAVELIFFDKVYYRHDIGDKAIRR